MAGRQVRPLRRVPKCRCRGPQGSGSSILEDRQRRKGRRFDRSQGHRTPARPGRETGPTGVRLALPSAGSLGLVTAAVGDGRAIGRDRLQGKAVPQSGRRRRVDAGGRRRGGHGTGRATRRGVPAAAEPASAAASPSIIHVDPNDAGKGDGVVIIRDPSAIGQNLRIAHLPDKALIEDERQRPAADPRRRRQAAGRRLCAAVVGGARRPRGDRHRRARRLADRHAAGDRRSCRRR